MRQIQDQGNPRYNYLRTISTSNDGGWDQGSVTAVDNFSNLVPGEGGFDSSSVALSNLNSPDIQITSTYTKVITTDGYGGTEDTSTLDQAINFSIGPDGTLVAGDSTANVHLTEADIIKFAQQMGYDASSITPGTRNNESTKVFSLVPGMAMQVDADGTVQVRSVTEINAGQIPNPAYETAINSQSELAAAVAIGLSHDTVYSREREAAISQLPQFSPATRVILSTINHGINNAEADPSQTALNAYVQAGESFPPAPPHADFNR